LFFSYPCFLRQKWSIYNAELKSDFLSHYASDVIVKEHPDMQKLMIKKTAVLNWQMRNLEITDIKV